MIVYEDIMKMRRKLYKLFRENMRAKMFDNLRPISVTMEVWVDGRRLICMQAKSARSFTLHIVHIFYIYLFPNKIRNKCYN